jgi:enoyl-CoA hydratase/carnithine racemase
MDQQPTAAHSQITCEIDDSIMIITLNRPDKLNAYTGAMGSEIEAAFRAADADDNVRAIIVTGSGRAFCAGATFQAAPPVSIHRASTVPVCSATGWPAVRRVREAASSMRCSAAESPRLPPSTVRRSASESP